MRFLIPCVFILSIVPAALAEDEIFFKNGDRLKGEILTTDKGRMKFKSPMLGEVQFNLSQLESFKSDKPLDLRFKDGTRAAAPVADANQGEIVIAPNTPAARSVKTEQIRAVNPREGWTGSVAAGANFARGNTDAEQANIQVHIEKRTEKDRILGQAVYHFGRQRDTESGQKTTSIDNWSAQAKYDYFYRPELYGYTTVRAEQDNIARLSLRLTPGIGLGYQPYDTTRFSLQGEGGVTYVYEKFARDDATPDDSRDMKEYLGGRLAYKAQWNPVDRLTLFHNGEWLQSLQDIQSYLFNLDAGARFDITSHLFAEYKMMLQYNSMPAPGASDTDLRHMISIGWQF